MELHVKVQISPPPKTVDKKEVDKLLDGELTRFEEYVQRKGREAGSDGMPLASHERGIIKAYIYYAATERDADV